MNHTLSKERTMFFFLNTTLNRFKSYVNNNKDEVIDYTRYNDHC
jgi:hypothetical protein